MAALAEPEAILSPLPRADGSASYSYGGYSITASVNGPLEAGRRDEDPYEAIVDVIVRPSAGVGGTSERHLESILQSSLKQIILVKDFPRSLIQVVLQITASPENDYVNPKLVQASLNLGAIPALLQTAVLALLSAAMPLRTTATSTVLAILADADGGPVKKRIVADPSARELELALSAHAFAFTPHEELLLVESEGDFTMQEWDEVYAAAREICCGAGRKSGVDAVLGEDEGVERRGPDLQHFLRTTMESKVAADLYWK